MMNAIAERINQQTMATVVAKIPITLDPEKDIPVTQGDLHTAKVRMDFAYTLASLMQLKRKHVLNTENKHEILPGHPEVTLYVGPKDLSGENPLAQEKNIHELELVEAILRFSQAKAEVRARIQKSIAPHLSELNTHVIRPKTDGHYGLSFIGGILAIRDLTPEKKYPLIIDGEVYDNILTPSGMKNNSSGFSNEVIERVAAAGLMGVAVSELGIRNNNERSLHVRVHQTNAVFRDNGFETIEVRCVGEKLYLFDYRRNEHYEKLQEIKKTQPEPVKSTAAERKMRHKYKPATAKLSPTKNHPLVIDGEVYEKILTPFGRRNNGYGFSKKVIERVAAAGLAGIAVDELDMPRSNERKVQVRASQANFAFRRNGYDMVQIRFIDGRLYLFDYQREAHYIKLLEVRSAQPKITRATAAEFKIRERYKEAANQATDTESASPARIADQQPVEIAARQDGLGL